MTATFHRITIMQVRRLSRDTRKALTILLCVASFVPRPTLLLTGSVGTTTCICITTVFSVDTPVKHE